MSDALAIEYWTPAILVVLYASIGQFALSSKEAEGHGSLVNNTSSSSQKITSTGRLLNLQTEKWVAAGCLKLPSDIVWRAYDFYDWLAQLWNSSFASALIELVILMRANWISAWNSTINLSASRTILMTDWRPRRPQLFFAAPPLTGSIRRGGSVEGRGGRHEADRDRRQHGVKGVQKSWTTDLSEAGISGLEQLRTWLRGWTFTMFVSHATP